MKVIEYLFWIRPSRNTTNLQMLRNTSEIAQNLQKKFAIFRERFGDGNFLESCVIRSSNFKAALRSFLSFFYVKSLIHVQTENWRLFGHLENFEFYVKPATKIKMVKKSLFVNFILNSFWSRVFWHDHHSELLCPLVGLLLSNSAISCERKKAKG